MKFNLVMATVAALFALCVSAVGKYSFAQRDGNVKDPGRPLFWGIMGTMLMVRVVLAAAIEGFECDVHTFEAWAIEAAKNLGGFYSGGFFADYPPGYMYVLFVIGKIKEALLLPDSCTAFQILIKTPSILADMGTVGLLYLVARGPYGKRAALAVSCLYGFNPAVILDSAVWGQVDAVFAVFIAISIILLKEDRLILSAGCFAAALLMKPQALIFTPLLLAAVADKLLICRQPGSWKRVVWGSFLAIAVFAAGVLIFAVHEGPLWIFRHYRTTLASYPYASVNAFNLFALTGGNFIPQTDLWHMLPYQTWSIIFIALATVASFWVYFRSDPGSRLYIMGMFLTAAVFIFSARMHERYLFPVMVFALLAAIQARSRRILSFYTGFSITLFINAGYVLFKNMRGISQISRVDPVLMATAIGNLLLFCWLVRHFAWGRPGANRPNP